MVCRHADGRPINIQFPFSPYGLEALTPFVLKGDWPSDPSDPATWASCIPSLGHTVTADAIAAEDVAINRAIGAAGLELVLANDVGNFGGRSVLVLDHAARTGSKIRISGGGRCNFTNRNVTAGMTMTWAACLLGDFRIKRAVGWT